MFLLVAAVAIHIAPAHGVGFRPNTMLVILGDVRVSALDGMTAGRASLGIKGGMGRNGFNPEG